MSTAISNADTEEELTLSQAAAIMSSSKSTPEQRSAAARTMGRIGGKNSHNRDGGIVPSTQAVAEGDGV